MTKNWIKIGVYSFCNETFIGRWFLELSRSLSTFRGTQTIPIHQPATFNEPTTPPLTLASWLPRFLLSHPYITAQCPKQQTKGRGKTPSPHLSLSGREQGFSQKPQQTLLDTSLAGTRSPDQLWLQEELIGKNEVFPYFISGSGLCQVGTAGCLCLHTKPGERETV